MVKKNWIYLLVFVMAYLPAQKGVIQDQFQMGKAYFEAEQYQEAITCYESLMKDQKTSAKKDILLYNLATSYLADGNYSKAIENFLQITSYSDNKPSYLLEKTYHNLTLASILKIEEKLEKNIEEIVDLNEEEVLLKNTTEYLDKMVSLSEELAEESLEEIETLKNRLKDIRSRLIQKMKELEFKGISFQAGVNYLLNHSLDHITKLEVLNQEKENTSYAQYFFNKEYVTEKNQLGYWQHLESKIQEEFKKVKNTYDSDSNAEKKKEELEKVQQKEFFFEQAYNNHLAAIDYLNENKIWRSRTERAKSNINLYLIEGMETKKDVMDRFFEDKIKIKKKLGKEELSEGYVNSLQEEKKYVNDICYASLEARDFVIKDIKEKAQKHTISALNEEDITSELSKRLRARLRRDEEEETIEDLYQDYFHYKQLSKLEGETLLEVYSHWNSLEKDPAVHNQFKYQLTAVLEQFDCEKMLKKDEERQKKLDFYLLQVNRIATHFDGKEYEKALSELEKTLINLEFKEFITRKLNDLKGDYKSFSGEEKIDLKTVSTFISRHEDIRGLTNQIQDSKENSKDVLQLEAMLSNCERNLSYLHQESVSNLQSQKLLAVGPIHFINHFQCLLNKEKLSPAEILQLGISEEQYAHQTTTSDDFKDDFITLTKEGQKYPIESTASFEAALEKDAQNQSKDLDVDKVLKFFHLGLNEAREAQALLEKDNIKWNDVSNKQSMVISYWEKALNELKKNKSSNDKNSQNNLSANNKPTEEPEQKNESHQELSEELAQNLKSDPPSELLQKFQEMEFEDKQINKQKQKVKKGSRPW